MMLQLEYTCTEAELKEAQSLDLHRQCGSGPKWRSGVVYYAFIAFIATLVYLRFKMEIAPKDRLWFIALVVVIFIALQIFKGMTRRKTDQLVRLEVSEREVVFNSGNGHTALSWSAFSQCLESPNLYVLLDRPKLILYAVPTRAFPDEKSQEWFRAQAKQLKNQAAMATDEPFVPGRSVTANGITLTLQLKYRDYLTRMSTSWRTKGIALGFFALAIGFCLFAPDPPNAVNSRGKTLIIMLAMMIPMLLVVFFVVSFISWRSEKKYLTPHQIVLTSEGIEFTSRDSSSRLPWSTYKYFLQNRWSFLCGTRAGRSGSCFPNASSRRHRIWSSAACCCKRTCVRQDGFICNSRQNLCVSASLR